KRIGTLPGVQSVAGSNGVPLRDDAFETPITVEGHPAASPKEIARITAHPVTESYFATMQTKIVRGQGVSDRDRLGMPINVVITETAARRLFPNEDPI